MLLHLNPVLQHAASEPRRPRLQDSVLSSHSRSSVSVTSNSPAGAQAEMRKLRRCFPTQTPLTFTLGFLWKAFFSEALFFVLLLPDWIYLGSTPVSAEMLASGGSEVAGSTPPKVFARVTGSCCDFGLVCAVF